jgi:hypothetical protein
VSTDGLPDLMLVRDFGRIEEMAATPSVRLRYVATAGGFKLQQLWTRTFWYPDRGIIDHQEEEWRDVPLEQET